MATDERIEKWAKDRLKKLLNKYEAYFVMVVPGGLGKGGIPDFLGWAKDGRPFGIEAKRPGRREEKNAGATTLQVIELEKMKKAGAFTMIFDGEDDHMKIVTKWLEGV